MSCEEEKQTLGEIVNDRRVPVIFPIEKSSVGNLITIELKGEDGEFDKNYWNSN